MPTRSSVGPHVRRDQFRGNRQADVEALAKHAGVPVYNGLTEEWHPTQMLADFLTMHEASDKPYDAIGYAVHRRLPVQHGPVAAGHGRADGLRVRLAGPAELHPPKKVVDLAHQIAEQTGARIAITDDVAEAVRGVDFIHTDVWVSMGEPKDVWAQRVRLLAPYQINAALLDKTGNPASQVHAPPAGVPRYEHRRRPRDHGAHRHGQRPRSHRRGLPPQTPASCSIRPKTASTPSRPSSSLPSASPSHARPAAETDSFPRG